MTQPGRVTLAHRRGLPQEQRMEEVSRLREELGEVAAIASQNEEDIVERCGEISCDNTRQLN